MQTPNRMNTGSRIVLASLLLALSMLSPAPTHAAAFLIDIPGPPDSVEFGGSVTVLSNGNFVVTDTNYNAAKGAVYLYSPDRVLISRLTGTVLNDRVGSGGITVLTNGNFVVSSPIWSSGTAYSQMSVGAVTWCSQVTGCNGTVSASNSLVGGSNFDEVGSVRSDRADQRQLPGEQPAMG